MAWIMYTIRKDGRYNKAFIFANGEKNEEIQEHVDRWFDLKSKGWTQDRSHFIQWIISDEELNNLVKGE